MTSDLGAWYREARLRISALVDDDVASLPVAATPSWDVHDVIAHLTGIVDDAISGNMAGVTTDPWTAAQVARGAGRSVAEMLEHWAATAPMVESVLSSPAGASSAAAIIDLHTHECDLLTALGRPIAVPTDALAWIDEQLWGSFAGMVADAGLEPVTVDAPALEVFRSRLGRRTVAETTAMRWSADPGPYLDHWFVFGSAARSLGEQVPA